jgi:hypothetical protein
MWIRLRRSVGCRWSDPDALAVLAAFESGQRFAFARPGDALTAFDQEQRAVGCTLNQAGTAVEKLIGQPLQADTAMGAAILVDKDLACPAHGKDAHAGQFEAAALSFWNVFPFTQEFQGDLLGARCAQAVMFEMDQRPGAHSGSRYRLIVFIIVHSSNARRLQDVA